MAYPYVSCRTRPKQLMSTTQDNDGIICVVMFMIQNKNFNKCGFLVNNGWRLYCTEQKHVQIDEGVARYEQEQHAVPKLNGLF